MNDYWTINPPTHVLVAAYFGLGESNKEPEVEQEMDFATLLAGVPLK